MSITKISPEERRGLFGVSFQDYAKFSLTLKENVLINEGNSSQKNKEIMNCFEIDKIANSLADGYDTVLGKLFGNAVDLSGGQWQSISISRALVGEKDIYIFDEPTASLDPIREVDMFMKINEIAKSQIRIFITHRLGITTKVDKIIMLRNGEVVEQGSFKELIRINGYFKDMFDKQKSLYFKGEA